MVRSPTRYSLAIAAGVVTSLLATTVAVADPFRTALEGLLADNPRISQRQEQVVSAHHGVDGAFGGYLPRLDVNAATGPQYIDSPVAQSAGGGAWFRNSRIAGVRLSQPLFDGFATPAEVRSAKLNLEVAEFTLAGTKQEVLFDGIEAYAEVRRQVRLVELARVSEQNIMRQLHLEDERVLRGAGIAVDVLQSKARLQIAKERRVGFEGALADATARYQRLFSRAPELARMQDPPPPPPDVLPASVDEATRVAADENPAVGASLATVAVAGERRRLARSDYFPNVDIVSAFNQEKDNDLVEGTRTDYSVMVQATWNLFNGFRTNAGVAQAAADYNASISNHDSVAREVVEEARLAWNELATARDRVALLENAAAIAEEVYDARHKLREAGRETVINVLDAENEVYNARINLTAARTDGVIAGWRLMQAMGRLNAAVLGIEVSDPRHE